MENKWLELNRCVEGSPDEEITGTHITNGMIPSYFESPSRLRIRFSFPSKTYRDLINFLILLFILSSCNDTFQPFQESDSLPISIYGYLDASADTQWVRVTPVRELIEMPPIKPEMEVTLEHLTSGDKVVMNDSLMQLRQGVNVMNAWTTWNIDPNQTYMMVARRPDGATSRVTVTLPKDFPQPVIHENFGGCSGTLHINEVFNLIDIQSKWHVRILYMTEGVVTFQEDRFFTIPHRDRALRLGAGNYTVSLDSFKELAQFRERLLIPPYAIQVIHREIFVASAGPEWRDEFSSIEDLIYFLPDQFSNVENGLGFLVGIVSKTIPWMSCFQPSGDLQIQNHKLSKNSL